jgi:hypothetical protein
MDLVRRAEQEVASTLKKSRYLWLTNPRRLSAGQRRRLAHVLREHRESAEVYRSKLAFEDFSYEVAKRHFFCCRDSGTIPARDPPVRRQAQPMHSTSGLFNAFVATR